MREVKIFVVDGAMVVIEYGHVTQRDAMALKIDVNGDATVEAISAHDPEVDAVLGFPRSTVPEDSELYRRGAF